MSLFSIFFYLFALITVVSALFVVSVKNVVHSAFYLLFTFFGVAGLYVLLGADFIAVTQIMVYIGGILILLLFGVMLTNKITNIEIKSGTVNIFPAIVLVGVLMGALVSVITRTNWKVVQKVIPNTTINSLGKVLITDYVLIFELLAILLLVALIGATSIARTNNTNKEEV
ncbi:MAG TPA: NADH-quinone oxidoreductase subunit J [Melioribacteraceae bacterium]|nr:NADH-quinone oxidoreductase subunit J [Melioribacteraceae bacterium]